MLQMPQFGVPHARRVEQHQHGAMRQVMRCFDQLRHLVDAEDRREPAWGLGVRRVIQQVSTLQRLHEEEAQRGDVESDGTRHQLPLAQQVRLIGS
jgi:hypothetical protein